MARVRYGDEFTVRVEKLDKIWPLLAGIGSDVCPYDPRDVEIYLFKNPRDAPRDAIHSKRIKTLMNLNPPSVDEATRYILSMGANAVMKLKVDEKLKVVKLAHARDCNSSPRSEAYISEALSAPGIEVVPKFLRTFNPDPHRILTMICEEYVGGEIGWHPLFGYGSSLDPEKDPLVYGMFVGKIHAPKLVRDYKGRPTRARMLFNDTFRHHVVRNPDAENFGDVYKVVDPAEIELVTQSELRESVQQRFVNEAKWAIAEHWATAYYFLYGVSHKVMKERNDDEYVKNFCRGYNITSGAPLNNLNLRFNDIFPLVEEIRVPRKALARFGLTRR